MDNFSLSTLLLFLLIFALFIGFLLIFSYLTKQKIEAKKIALLNDAACKKAKQEHTKRLLTDYFWSDYMRFAWIMLFLVFTIALGFALESILGYIISTVFIIITIFFLRFAKRSYKAFPTLAAERLEKFEKEVMDALENEISFKGDNIQVFSKEDEAFDTNPKIFSFPTNITKIKFPPFQTNANKQPIIHTKKLEFLILSREYFSICQEAATFNLLNPDRAGPPKKCAELPGKAGECHEHYYSQMRNVEYDSKEECIRIIYYDERDDVTFPCKKINPDRKPAVKALQEKLRLTERQRLHKIDEHAKYEAIRSKRVEKEENKKDNDELNNK